MEVDRTWCDLIRADGLSSEPRYGPSVTQNLLLALLCAVLAAARLTPAETETSCSLMWAVHPRPNQLQIPNVDTP